MFPLRSLKLFWSPMLWTCVLYLLLLLSSCLYWDCKLEIYISQTHLPTEVCFRFHQKGLCQTQGQKKSRSCVFPQASSHRTRASAEARCGFLWHHLGILLPFMDLGAVGSRDHRWCFYESFQFYYFQRLYKQLVLYINFSLAWNFLNDSSFPVEFWTSPRIWLPPPKKKLIKGGKKKRKGEN